MTKHDLDTELKRAVIAVRQNGGSATVALKIKIKGEKNEGQVSITDEVTSTLPKASRPMILAYTDGDGHLSESDPMQGVLKFSPGQKSTTL